MRRGFRAFSCALVIAFLFALISCLCFYPLFLGKGIYQPDWVNDLGGFQEIAHYRAQTAKESYWTNAIFGGMPTYQYGAQYPHYWISQLSDALLFLPHPVGRLFLLFAGFFLLIYLLKKDNKAAMAGAFFFAFSSYYFQIIAAGHNAKILAIAYIPPVVAGILLLYRGKYLWGFLLTTLFMGLELAANHPQMTYYMGLMLIPYGLIELVKSLKDGFFRRFLKSTLLALFAGVLALGMNAQRYLSTYEYTTYSTRGETTQNKGLDSEYITQWSYGLFETLNLFVPHLMGGGSPEDLPKPYLKKALARYSDSQKEQKLYGQLEDLPLYWGDQPYTEGPAYEGAVVIFLFILGIFVVKNRLKWWILSVTLLGILLSWGKHFMLLSSWFIKYFPFYAKFRAVSSVLIIPEFATPLLAVLGLCVFLHPEKIPDREKKRVLFTTSISLTILLLGLNFLGPHFLSFSSPLEQGLPKYFSELFRENGYVFHQIKFEKLMNALKWDRISIFRADIYRSLFFVALSFTILYAFLSKRCSPFFVWFLLTLISTLDLSMVNYHYLNEDRFLDKTLIENPFPIEISPRLKQEASQNPWAAQMANRVLLNKKLFDLRRQDKDTYRVMNLVLNPFSETHTSYFHHSIGGYHAAKPRAYQELIERYLLNMNQQVLNMLNTRYFIIERNGIEVITNTQANGNAWFVNSYEYKKNRDQKLMSLDEINTREVALVDQSFQRYLEDFKIIPDKNNSITLTSYSPDELIYHSLTKSPQLAVFSEIYYPKGWKAFIDGKEADYIRANYLLRALRIPSGVHEIRFIFSPEIVVIGGRVSLISHAIFLLCILGILYKRYAEKKDL
ncbi:YfhO family protein [Bacteroidetes bacterium endosymbiont of Geopemphigus sp.]|uniref:YfhO family protein n=1 Tax=Bacteroidetes bacterium endosymbiont of Geopemphigus sp. TaxID=2047937 RepID=UPI000CD07142|nr:YfhO family protein [Bacteroidetes bacterium endosymbiont of Geopemphigus sp.]